jgi:hypothetical protein
MKMFLISLIAMLAVCGLMALISSIAPNQKISWRSMRQAGFRPFSGIERVALPFVQAMRGLSIAAHLTLHPNRIALANDNLTPKTHHCNKTYKSDGAIAKYLLLKLGTDAGHVDVCAAANMPIGNSEDSPAAAEDPLSVELFGVTDHTRIGIASEAIAAGVDVYTAAGGKIQDLPVANGTYYLVGHSLQAAAADGDKFEFVPCKPIKTVI